MQEERLMYSISRRLFPELFQSLVFARNLGTMEASKKTNIAPNTIGTHSGTFHCDEVLATFLLKELEEYKSSPILRTRDLKLLEQCEIVVDVGGVYNHSAKRYDHHQITFNETFSTLRPEYGSNFGNIRLSSAGLIYAHYGEEVISQYLKKHHDIVLSRHQLESVFKKIYSGFIQEIDGIDNGVPQFEGEPLYQIKTNLSNRVKSFNPNWMESKTPDEIDQLFQKAMKYVGNEFVDKVEYFATSWLPARKIVEKALENRFNVHDSGEIIELERFAPWSEHLREIEKEISIGAEIKYVLYDSGSQDFRVQCVPVENGSFVCRKFLHKSWFGLRDEELEKKSGIQGIKFCHATGFIGGHKTRDGALKMADISLKAED